MTQDNDNRKSYSFDVEADLWNDWKRTVPRDQSLDSRIIELIEEDLESNR